MEVERFDDAGTFRELADPLLLENEAANNLILGVTGAVRDDPERFEGFRSWIVFESGVALAAAAQTPPRGLILAIPRSGEGADLLAGELGDLPGVIGCPPGVEQFVESRPEHAKLTMSQGIFQLDTVITPPPVEGTSRPARPDEVDALLRMRLDFEDEAIGRVDDPDLSRRSTEWRLEEQSPRFGLWVHESGDGVVSMTGHSGATPNGIRIGPVYTPPEHRGRGYASALVATQSQWLLDHGLRFCFLYTDLSNPTSNAIYQRIGYRQIAESAEYAFSPTT